MLENLKKLESDGVVGGSDYFKVQNGNNIIRVLTEGVYKEDNYQGRKSSKFVMFIIDRKDGKVKPYFAPYTVYKAIASLEEDPFYKFQGMPIPFDINIKAAKAGTKEVEYQVQASPNRTELTGDEIAAARDAGSITDYVAKLDEGKNNEPAPAKAMTEQEAADFIAS
jgi:hypothetical protein